VNDSTIKTSRDRTRRAGIYVRVSQDRTGDEATTQRQENDCRDLCRLKGWAVVDVYRDVDVSAYDRRVRRPEFDRLKTDLSDGRIDAVVFWKLDRLARRTRDVTEVLDLLDEHGAMASVQDSLDTSTPHGRGMVELMTTMAYIASADTSARVKRAKLEEARGGRDPGGGLLPFGWKVETVERTEGDRTRQVMISSDEADPAQAAALQEVVRRFLDDGASLSGLAKELTARGFRTNPGRHSPTGKEIVITNLRGVLTNPRLAGYRQHRGGGDRHVIDLYPATWEAIVSEDQFRRLQERFGNRVVDTEDGLKLVIRGTERRQVSTERNLLTGLIWCGACATGRMRLMRSKKNGTRYVCRACGSIAIGQDVAERHVVGEALTLLMGRRMLGHDRPDVDLAALETELDGLRDRLRDLSVARFVDGRITDDEYEVARGPLHERVAAAEGRLTQAKEMRPAPIPGDVREGFDTWWDKATLAERRRVLEGTVDRIVIAPMSHDVTRPFRRPDRIVDEATAPAFTGVPKALWPDVARARITITWRPEMTARPSGEVT
jgi:site-specific DNA recombinase